MKRRDFLQTMGAAAAGGMLARAPVRSAKKLERIGLETYAVRHAMAQDPDRTLAAIRAIGYTDVELLWSFNLFGRTPQQVADTLKKEGLRAPSAHMSADTIFVGWERSLEIAKVLPRVRVRAGLRGLDQEDAGRLAGMGRPLQCGRRGGAQARRLARLPQRVLPPEAHRRSGSVRRLHLTTRSFRHSTPARRRQHAHRRRRPHEVFAAVLRSVLELSPQGRPGGSFQRHVAGQGDLRLQEVPGGGAEPR